MVAALAAAAELKLSEAVKRSYEQLKLEAQAHNRRGAVQMMQFMVACNGDADSWNAQKQALLRIIREK